MSVYSVTSVFVVYRCYVLIACFLQSLLPASPVLRFAHVWGLSVSVSFYSLFSTILCKGAAVVLLSGSVPLSALLRARSHRVYLTKALPFDFHDQANTGLLPCKH